MTRENSSSQATDKTRNTKTQDHNKPLKSRERSTRSSQNKTEQARHTGKEESDIRAVLFSLSLSCLAIIRLSLHHYQAPLPPPSPFPLMLTTYQEKITLFVISSSLYQPQHTNTHPHQVFPLLPSELASLPLPGRLTQLLRTSTQQFLSPAFFLFPFFACFLYATALLPRMSDPIYKTKRGRKEKGVNDRLQK